MSYLLSYQNWAKLNEQKDISQLSNHEQRLVNRFIRKIENDDSISDLIDRKDELPTVDPAELEKLAQNLSIDTNTLNDWIAGRRDDSEFIRSIAQNLLQQGSSRQGLKQALKSADPVTQLADIAAGQKMLKLGSTGEDVRTIQQKLYDLGFMDSEPTGSFDTETDAAVREFQKSKDIGVDGIVGPITYSQLYGIKLKPIVDLSGSDYESIVKSVIDNLEGGYYHPNMRQKNPAKFPGYEHSGETMFGLDRFAGHDMYYSTPRIGKSPMADLENIESGKYEYKNEDARQFWNIIDSADAKNKWSWNYRGGQYENQLEELAGKIMRPVFERWFGKYLSASAQEIVKNDPALMYHFVYATWNGEGWFRKFATDLNQAVLSGTTDPAVLRQAAIDSRTKEGKKAGLPPNRMIAQGGKKIEKMFGMA
jgi:hypothetical protein